MGFSMKLVKYCEMKSFKVSMGCQFLLATEASALPGSLTVHHDHVEVLLLLEALERTHAADVFQTPLQLLHLILVVFNLKRSFCDLTY